MALFNYPRTILAHAPVPLEFMLNSKTRWWARTRSRPTRHSKTGKI